MSDNRLSTGLHVILVLVCMLQLANALTTSPGAVYDARMGFVVLDSMQRGAGPNRYFNADFADITRDIQVFEPTWAPGQYLMPGLVQLLGLDLGRSVQVVNICFGLLGIAGIYALSRFFEFSPLIAAAAGLVAASARFFTNFFITYSGGEVLLFGVIPWIVLVVARLDPRDARWAGLILLLLLAGAVAKHTFLICMAALFCGLLAYRLSSTAVNNRDLLRYAVAMAAICGFVYAVDYLFYLRYRPIPLFRAQWESVGFYWPFVFVFGSPSGDVLSLAALASRLKSFFPFSSISDGVYLHSYLAVNVATLLCVLAAKNDARYKSIALVFVLVFTVLMYVMFLTTGVSYQTRHFRSPGIVLLPGIIACVLGLKHAAIRSVLLLFLAGTCVFGLRPLLPDSRDYKDRVDANGLVERFSVSDVALLKRLETCSKDALFYVRDPGLVLSLDARYLLDRHPRVSEPIRGHVDRLFVVLASNATTGATATDDAGDEVLRRFVGYSHVRWRLIKGDAVRVYASGPCGEVDGSQGAATRLEAGRVLS